MVDIKSVAKKANVSIATVSRVINRSCYVSEKTRCRVLEAIEELEYKPNILARNFRQNQSRTIITILNDISNPVFGKFIKGMEDVAFENNYQLLIGNTGHSFERAMKYIEILQMRKADGAILITPRILDKTLEQLEKVIPIVLINHFTKDFSIPTVMVDNMQASYDITQYLIDRGHIHIGYISGNTKTNIGAERRKGFEKALKDNGLLLNSSWIIEGEHLAEEGYKAMKKLISMDKRPTALACYNDNVAIGAIRCAHDYHLSIPKDMSIVGFDNISTSSIIYPKLTTVNQPEYKMGMKAMNILLSMIRGEEVKNKKVVMKHYLIERDSVQSYNQLWSNPY